MPFENSIISMQITWVWSPIIIHLFMVLDEFYLDFFVVEVKMKEDELSLLGFERISCSFTLPLVIVLT